LNIIGSDKVHVLRWHPPNEAAGTRTAASRGRLLHAVGQRRWVGAISPLLILIIVGGCGTPALTVATSKGGAGGVFLAIVSEGEHARIWCLTTLKHVETVQRVVVGGLDTPLFIDVASAHGGRGRRHGHIKTGASGCGPAQGFAVVHTQTSLNYQIVFNDEIFFLGRQPADESTATGTTTRGGGHFDALVVGDWHHWSVTALKLEESIQGTIVGTRSTAWFIDVACASGGGGRRVSEINAGATGGCPAQGFALVHGQVILDHQVVANDKVFGPWCQPHDGITCAGISTGSGTLLLAHW
jgi:uncharacterized protein YceK